MIEFFKSHKQYFYILLALLGNAFLVLCNIGEKGIWLDEAVSWQFAILDHDELLNSVKYIDKHPPLYYIFLSWWVRYFGTSEFALRFPSFLFGSITIIFAFNISKNYFDNFTTGLLLILLSLYPFLIHFQQEARMYSLLLMFLILTLNFLLKLMNRQYPLFSTILVTSFSIAAMYTHYYGIFGVLSLYAGLIVYCFMRNYWKRLILLISSLISSFIAFYPWIKTMRDQSQSYAVGGIHEVTFYQLLNFAYHSFSFAQSFNGENSMFKLLINFVFIISLTAFIHTNIKLIMKINNITKSFDRGERVFLYLETVFITNFLGPVIVSITKFPLGYSIYNTRYFIFPLVLSKIILAYCMSVSIHDIKFSKVEKSGVAFNFKFLKIKKKQYLQFLILIILIVFQIGYNVSKSTDDAGYRELVNFIEFESAEYIPILVEPFYNRSPLNYYLNDTWQQYVEYVYLNDTFSRTIDRLRSVSQMWFTYSISKSTQNYYDLFLISGNVDPYYDRIEFGQLILLKLISNSNITNL